MAVRRATAVLATAGLFGAVPVLAPAAADAASKPKVTITNTQSGYVSKSGATGTYNSGATASFETTITPNKAGQKVTWQLQRFVDGTWFDDTTFHDTIDQDSTDGDEIRGANGGLYRERYVYPGDDSNAMTASVWQNVQYKGKETDLKQAKVDLDPNGGKKDGKYTSCKAGGKCSVTATVAPNRAGNKVKFTADELVKGKWKQIGTDSQTLNKNSAATVPVNGMAGKKYRIYAAYLGDSKTSRGSSTPVYFEFTK